MLRFLAFDPAGLFESFVAQTDLKTLFSVDCTTERDPASFTEKLQGEYEAIVILEKGHFSEALALAKKAQGRTTIFFVTEHRTASSFEKLKKELGVTYVLQTPLLADEMIALFHRLSEKEPSAEEGLPPELVEKYRESIYGKITRIETLCRESKGNAEKLKELRTEVHKIAGSASSYGFRGASLACKAHELFLVDHKESNEEVAKRNAVFLRKLRLHFQHIDVKTQAAPHKEVPQTVETARSDALMLVSTDLPLVHTFQTLAERFRVPLVVESNPRKLQESFGQAAVKLKALIVEEYYPFSAVTGLQLIDTVRKTTQEKIQFGVISNTEDVNKRIAWTESGIDWVLKKPITENNILQVFQQMETQQFFPNTRALIVDDDEDVGMIEKQLLANMGMEVVFLSDERNLLRTLEEFTPHLLLLDVNLPHFNGERLLQMLRSDVRFQRMIIVLVTGFKEKIHENEIYQKNCDSIIYKPIDPQYLQSRLANLLHRRMAVGLKTILDATTSLYKKNYFLEKTERHFPHVRHGRAALMLLEVDLWDQISQNLSSTEKKQVIILVANGVKQYFGGKSIYGYMGGARFALFFENLAGGEVEFMLETFLAEMKKTIWLAGREDVRFTLSSGGVLFQTAATTLAEAMDKAGDTLASAQEKGGKQVLLARLTESVAVATETKKVVLVDDDEELCEVIAYMFRNQGIHVDVFHTGADAVDFFAKLERVDQNMLFILDRMLPDRDGLTLLRMIKEKFPGRVKALFLTSLSSEKDILEGLKMGAVDYITKPFSISVLLQKALALLNQ